MLLSCNKDVLAGVTILRDQEAGASNPQIGDASRDPLEVSVSLADRARGLLRSVVDHIFLTFRFSFSFVVSFITNLWFEYNPNTKKGQQLF